MRKRAVDRVDPPRASVIPKEAPRDPRRSHKPVAPTEESTRCCSWPVQCRKPADALSGRCYRVPVIDFLGEAPLPNFRVHCTLAPTEGPSLRDDGPSTSGGPLARTGEAPHGRASGRAGLSALVAAAQPLTRRRIAWCLKTSSEQAERRSFGRAQAVGWVRVPRERSLRKSILRGWDQPYAPAPPLARW